MKIPPALLMGFAPPRSPAFSTLTGASEPFSSLLDGPAETRQDNRDASFGFAELGFFGRDSRLSMAAEEQDLIASAAAAPNIPAATPDGRALLRGQLAPHAPGGSKSQAIQAGEITEQVPGPPLSEAADLSTVNALSGLTRSNLSTPVGFHDGVDEPRATRPATPDAEPHGEAAVNVAVAEQDGRLEVVIGAAGLIENDRQAILRVVRTGAAAEGLIAGDITVNGETTSAHINGKKGGQDGRRFG